MKIYLFNKNDLNKINKIKTITFAYKEKHLDKITEKFVKSFPCNDEMHNNVKYTFKNGDTYQGQWKNSNIDGTRKYIFKDGSTYDGQWKNFKMHGNGKYTYKDGSTYQGQWNNDILTDIDEKFLSNFMWIMFKVRSGQLSGSLRGASNIFFKNIFKHINESPLYDKNFNNFIKNAKFKVDEIHNNLLSPDNLIYKLNNLINNKFLVLNPKLNGHDIIVECILLNDDKVKLSIYNSGDGLQYHHIKIIIAPSNYKIKYQTRKDFIFDKTTFIKEIVPLINNNTTVNHFYTTLLSHNNKKLSIDLLNKVIWQKSQVNGSCSIESYMAYFKNLGGEIVYNQFQLQMLDILKNKYSIDNNNLLTKELRKRYEKITEKIVKSQPICRLVSYTVNKRVEGIRPNSYSSIYR